MGRISIMLWLYPADDFENMATQAQRPLDSVEPASAEKKGQPAVEHPNLLDLVDSAKRIAVAPVANNFIVEPVNTVANVANDISALGTLAYNDLTGSNKTAFQVGKLTEMDLGHPAPRSAAALTQEVLGTAGSFLVYAVASKMAGGVLRCAGELAPAELAMNELKIGSAIRSVAQDSRVATVLGATTYAGLKDTHNGESHLSNAVSTFVGFSLFEAGNSKFISPGANLVEKFGQRFVVGNVGGIAQANAASLIQEHRFADSATAGAAGLSGGFLNALLPSGKHIIDGVVESPLIGGRLHVTEAASRLHEDAARALPKGEAPEPGSWADPASIKAIKRAATADLHTKMVVDGAKPTHINYNENLIYSNKSDTPLSVLQELAHARIHDDPKFEQQFREQARNIVTVDPTDSRNAGVKESYIDTRLQQEVEARTAQNAQAEALGSKLRVSVDPTEIRLGEGYGARFEREARQFIFSGGEARPAVDHSSGDNPHQYSSSKTGDTIVHTFYNTHIEGLQRNTFNERPDSHGNETVVGFGFEPNGRLRVEFGKGRIHNVNLGEPILHVRVVDKNDGNYNYYFNKKVGEPQLVVNSEYQEMKVLPRNGDKILITEVDEHGVHLPFGDKSSLSVTGDGRMTYSMPGKPAQIVELGTVPGRLAVVERNDGSKLLQLADADAKKTSAAKN